MEAENARPVRHEGNRALPGRLRHRFEVVSIDQQAMHDIAGRQHDGDFVTRVDPQDGRIVLEAPGIQVKHTLSWGGFPGREGYEDDRQGDSGQQNQLPPTDISHHRSCHCLGNISRTILRVCLVYVGFDLVCRFPQLR